MNTLLTLAVLGLLNADVQTTGDDGPTATRTKPAVTAKGADSVVTAAFAETPIGTLPEKPKTEDGLGLANLVAPTLAMLGLAGLALALMRRRRALPSSIRIVESASLGPKRSLVIADVLGERLVLAVSEAGVTVLASKEAPLAPEPTLPDIDVQPVSRTIPEMGFFQRLSGNAPKARFEDVLGESIEDQELRAKLAAGQRGTVP